MGARAAHNKFGSAGSTTEVYSQGWNGWKLFAAPISLSTVIFLSTRSSKLGEPPPMEEQEQGTREQEQGAREQEQGAREQEEGSRSQGVDTQEVQHIRRRQRVNLNGQASQWHKVTASIIQGSVLGPILAKCFSNSSQHGGNLQVEDKAFIVSKFADDEKRCRIVNNAEQGQMMQEDINNMVSWTLKMGVNLNQDKVHILHAGPSNMKRT